MPHPQLITAVYMFQLLTLFLFMRQRCQHHVIQSIESVSVPFNPVDFTSKNNQTTDIAIFLATISLHTPRSEWRRVRSSHWATNVFNGNLLKGKEFDQNFRMTCDSFEQLHVILGMPLWSVADFQEPYISLQDMTFHPATPSRVWLLVFLYHVMQGNNYQSTSNQFAIGCQQMCS